MNWHTFGRNPRRLIRSGLLALSSFALLGLSAATVLLTPAQASAEETSPCPWSGVLCLFDGPDYTGAVWNVMAWPPGGSGTCVGLPEHGWEDRAVSAINTNDQAAALFPNENCQGYPQMVGPGESASPLYFAPKSVWVY
ncbi:peptidase inhibitor family I36 protein [Myxococcus qinghaiensis]|uniref:peptidase inhibitor family I36 protein n=1 Tax=Myxococcus qinghaiensis TaxID=2906758 RepID=UPI0020A79B40|nr:peptidase inhibitor family I36 protein [Myxococcus qinghaiensis]MCP3169593.1 peptidase inhibitor family I36 protein [Myxococcus qinghaiensis]